MPFLIAAAGSVIRWTKSRGEDWVSAKDATGDYFLEIVYDPDHNRRPYHLQLWRHGTYDDGASRHTCYTTVARAKAAAAKHYGTSESPKTRVGRDRGGSIRSRATKSPRSRPPLRPVAAHGKPTRPSAGRASGVKTSRAGTPASRKGRKAHSCLSERRDGRRVTRQGRSASVGRAQSVDTPVGPQLRPYIAAGHGTRRSLPTAESASVPRHPFVIASPLPAEPSSSKPTHTYLRRAVHLRVREDG